MEKWVNTATFVAYMFLAIGILSQIRTTYLRATADDIDLVEVVGRFLAQIIIMWKMTLVADRPLMIGHATLTIVYSAYFGLVIWCKYLRKK